MIASTSIIYAYVLLNMWLGIGYLVVRCLLSFPYAHRYLMQRWRLALARLGFLLVASTPFIAPKIISWLPFDSHLNFQIKPLFHHATTRVLANSEVMTLYKPINDFSFSGIDLYDISVVLIAMGMFFFCTDMSKVFVSCSDWLQKVIGII